MKRLATRAREELETLVDNVGAFMLGMDRYDEACVRTRLGAVRAAMKTPTDADRIAALERRVEELEQRLKPLDCIGPDSRQGHGKAGA